ncbi:AraC-like DNA-binding protein [Flavobacterium sp. HSC-32F16]|uniref:helix-turn-helix domain-containing protein n=1 Tax=Flavobacterium sp. HSC-32F16 TaxID=2910964 RepID=UPI0020A5AF32|nr:AraC family transcriptional regulator [Flavobacterium sp. HSC-32F16]MCP2027827.1 AraC-like DNA-binding protein [Flavobacterium sp. HSC-32F16]
MNLDNWPKHIHKYLFLLKDDFFQLPYLYNSPQSMIKGLVSLPIAKHNPSSQFISVDSPLYNSNIYYRKIDESFWIMFTKMNMKQNVVTISSYDENVFNDYYFLNLTIFEFKFNIKDSKSVTLLNTSWTFNKPYTEVPNYFYKETEGTIISFAMKKDWLRKELNTKTIPERKEIISFLNNKRGFYRWVDIAPNAQILAKELSEILNQENSTFDHINLRKKSIQLILEFFKNSSIDSRIADNVSLSNSDYRNAAKAEKIIIKNLHFPFQGIEYIAKEVNTSPTKLKTNFKIIYGFSMLNYHKEKNMLFATQLIPNPEISIKDIANITGYNSSSRFSAAFKKRFGTLPSQVRLQ